MSDCIVKLNYVILYFQRFTDYHEWLLEKIAALPVHAARRQASNVVSGYKRHKPNGIHFYPPLNPLPRGEFDNYPLGRGLRGGFVYCLTKNIEIPIQYIYPPICVFLIVD